MATLLHIKSSIFGDAGQSAQLAVRYIAQWQQKHPAGELVERDIIADPVPHLDAERMQAFGSDADTRTQSQQAILDYADTLLAEVKAADQIVIGVPLYNFGVPSQVKPWLDHLARAGVTFSYTENGPVGLIEGKKVVLLATRGGMYRDQGADYQIPFMRQFLGFIGLTDVEVVYAEGLAMGDHAEQSLSQARGEVDQLVAAL